MTQPPPITPAQEAITNAMLAALLSCGALSLALIQHFKIDAALSYAILTMISFVVAGYLVPNAVAIWFGRPLHDIMTDRSGTQK